MKNAFCLRRYIKFSLTWSSIHSSVHPSIHPSINQSIQSSVHASIHISSVNCSRMHSFREDKHDGHPHQLPDPRHVPALQRPLHQLPLPHSGGFRPRDLRLLRPRDDRQGHCHGSIREDLLPGRFLEPLGHVHRAGRVGEFS